MLDIWHRQPRATFAIRRQASTTPFTPQRHWNCEGGEEKKKIESRETQGFPKEAVD